MGLAIKEKKTWLSVLWVLPNSKHGTQRFRLWDENMWLNWASSGIILTSLRSPCCAQVCLRDEQTLGASVSGLSIHSQQYLRGGDSGDGACANNFLYPLAFPQTSSAFPWSDSGAVGEAVAPGTRFQPQLIHFLLVWPWTFYLTSLFAYL